MQGEDILFRNMKRDGDAPLIGEGGLHIRPGLDVEATQHDELVQPGTGGLSTAPDNPMLLPAFRRPRSLGGTSKHPVWSMARHALGAYGLGSRRDGATHESIEPLVETTLANFTDGVHRTAPDWSLAHD
ncbi:hypothetical protein GCM10023258_37080 [Terrabacter aeriphilus]|uniref:Uncharacterized protein n=1 Tax=Terrabacter aeriphilus TaxID=515662 RepID=A0ABP9JMV3_9MICO